MVSKGLQLSLFYFVGSVLCSRGPEQHIVKLDGAIQAIGTVAESDQIVRK